MIFALTVALALNFTPDASRWSGALVNAAEAPKKITLALPGLRGADVSPEKAAFFSAHLATQLSREGIEVTAGDDIAAVLGLERQRQLLGCSEGSECMVEIANALGADGIVTGNIAKLGTDMGVNIKVLDGKTGKAIALFSANATSERAALDMLTAGAKDLAAQLRKQRGDPTVVTAGPKASPNALPAGTKFTTEPSAARKFGKWTMITAGVLIPVGLLSLVLGVVLPGDLGIFLVGLGLIELIAVPGVFLIGLVAYLIGEDKIVPVVAAIERKTGIQDLRFALAPSAGGALGGVAFRF